MEITKTGKKSRP